MLIPVTLKKSEMSRIVIITAWLSTCLVLCFLVQPAMALAEPRRELRLVEEARELVDTYYGNRANLVNAAGLLERAYLADSNDANIYIQAARITIMGGHIGFGVFEQGAFERYAALLDKAISLDPSNAKAHILRAEVFEKNGRFSEQFDELEKARNLGTNDPWLQIGYGRHYQKVGNSKASYLAYVEVMKRGPGRTASERKAYVASLARLSKFLVGDERYAEKLREYAAMALRERYPADAWTPLGYAEDFIDIQLFEDAIVYAREALKTMDFGAGRLAMAAALYGRAAQLDMSNGSSSEIASLISEARSFAFSRDVVLNYLLVRRGASGSMGPLAPSLDKIVR